MLCFFFLLSFIVLSNLLNYIRYYLFVYCLCSLLKCKRVSGRDGIFITIAAATKIATGTYLMLSEYLL